MQVVCPKCNGTKIDWANRKCKECSGLGYVTAKNVVEIGIVTTQDADPDKVLTQAMGKLDTVIIMGYDKDGEEYFASNKSEGSLITWLMDRLKHRLMRITDNDS